MKRLVAYNCPHENETHHIPIDRLLPAGLPDGDGAPIAHFQPASPNNKPSAVHSQAPARCNPVLPESHA